MKLLVFILTCLLGLGFTKSCPNPNISKDNTKKPAAEKPTESWKITFERTGGIAGFRDRLELSSDGKGQYFVGTESKTDFDMTSETMDRLRWVIGRDDFLKTVGEYKGSGKVMDDITYVIQIVKGDQIYHFKWASQALHPSVIDEIRPVFDEILADAINLSRGE